MTTLRILLLLFIPQFLLLTDPMAYAEGAKLPTRSECIVRVSSMTPSVTRFDLNGLNELMPLAARKRVPLAGYKVDGERIVYLQFSNRCAKKLIMTKSLLYSIFRPEDISISKKPVKPGIATINLYGAHWRDNSEQ